MNAGTGALDVGGFPDVVQSDTTYRVRVRLTHMDMKRAGFMLSTRTPGGAQAGSLRSVDDRTTTTSAGDVVYIHHALPGTFVEGDAHEWVFEWSTDGVADGASVVVHMAANAGNGDASPFGDWVYAGELRIQE